MKAQHNIEHIIFNSWKKKAKIKHLNNYDGKIVIGVSGGQDSMALLRGLLRCFPKEKIIVVHCHHGTGRNFSYRNSALQLVTEFCQKNALLCESRIAGKELKSEAEFRVFRLACLESACRQHQSKVVALAHHRDDWLENQLIKLIRGSSFASLRKGFQWSWLRENEFFIWRPLADCQRRDLEKYVHKYSIPYIDDPSNNESMYFRNWIRNVWLPQLEEFRPGGVNRLGQSLIQSIQDIPAKTEIFPWNFQAHSIDLIYFLSLSDAEKLRCLAFYVSAKGLKNIKSSQLKEVVKQLDKNTDHYHVHFKSFDCLINAGQLVLKFH